MGIFNADVIINIPLAFFSLQKSGLVRVYLTSVFLLLSVPRCFGDQKPQFDCLQEELLKELKTWGKEIWKIVSKESEAIGTRHTEHGNKCERNRSRVKNF